jgi:hypothetical protein
MRTKLTAVTVYFHGKTMTVFVHLPVVTAWRGSKRIEKVVASRKLINETLSKLGCNSRGLTYSIG